VKREKTQPGPGNYEVLKKMGKYHDDGKNKASSKPKTDDKEKDKKKKKRRQFPRSRSLESIRRGQKTGR